MATLVQHILEPDEDKVHYDSPNGLDQVTLCGAPDWIGRGKGSVTKRPVDCWSCQQIVAFVKGNEFA